MATPKTKITAQDFNGVLDQFNTYWNDDVPGAAFSTGITSTDPVATYNNRIANGHHLGWGQSPAEPVVTSNDIVASSHYNRLAAQINCALAHLQDINTSTPYTRFALPVGNAKKLTPDHSNIDPRGSLPTVISATHLNTLTTKISTLVSPEAHAAEVSRSHGLSEIFYTAMAHSNNQGIWETSISSVARVTFPSYKDARYFFNSGGSILYHLSAVGGTDGSDDWDGIFQKVNYMRLSAHRMDSLETLDGNPPMSTGGPASEFSRGFYGLTDTEQFMTSVTGYASSVDSGYGDYAGVGVGDDYTAYGSYGGLYNQRSVHFSGWGQQAATGEFNIYVRITLNEVEHAVLTDTDITLEVGYELPGDVPDYADQADPSDTIFQVPNLLSYFKEGSHVYNFEERTPPSIALHQTWTGS